MTRVGASRASIISTLEPISAALCGLVFLDEGLTPLQGLGGALVLAAVITLSAPNSSFTRPAAKGSPL
jgi:drug/metabolite transporter (DMT)-like permease